MRTVAKNEAALMTACAILLVLAFFAPPLALPIQYHSFADARSVGGVPHALNVMSNLPFAVAGVIGLYGLWAAPARTVSNVQRAMAVLFFTGLVLTAAGSSWYHWQPEDASLALDRDGMAVAFAGLLGLAAAGRVSERAGAALGLAVLMLAPLSIQCGGCGGNVTPWAVLQFGGVALLIWLALLRPRYCALEIRWLWVIAAYAAAKVLEMNDLQVYQWTGEWVSGHTLKHLVAALAAWPVISAVFKLRGARQNAMGAAITRSLSGGRAGPA